MEDEWLNRVSVPRRLLMCAAFSFVTAVTGLSQYSAPRAIATGLIFMVLLSLGLVVAPIARKRRGKPQTQKSEPYRLVTVSIGAAVLWALMHWGLGAVQGEKQKFGSLIVTSIIFGIGLGVISAVTQRNKNRDRASNRNT